MSCCSLLLLLILADSGGGLGEGDLEGLTVGFGLNAGATLSTLGGVIGPLGDLDRLLGDLDLPLGDLDRLLGDLDLLLGDLDLLLPGDLDLLEDLDLLCLKSLSLLSRPLLEDLLLLRDVLSLLEDPLRPGELDFSTLSTNSMTFSFSSSKIVILSLMF